MLWDHVGVAGAYEMAATRAAQAGLAGAHAHALICQAPPSV